MESIIAIIAGAFVVWGVIVRYKTINSYEFIKSTRVTVFIFTSLAVGLSVISPENVNKYFRNNIGDYFLLIILSTALFPVMLRIIRGEIFSSAFRWSGPIILTPIIFFSGLIIIGLLTDFSSESKLVVRIALFITLGIILGFIHSMLGSVIAGFNLALIIANFYNNDALAVNLSSVFDLLSLVGIESSPVQWTMIIASTLLGIHGAYDFEWIKEKLA